MEDALSPKRTYTQGEHDAAWLRFCLEDVSDALYDIVFAVEREGSQTPTPEVIAETIRTLLYPKDRKSIGYTGGEWYERQLFGTGSLSEAKAWFRKEATDGMHFGDCTGHATTCTRCMVDTAYGVNTVSWQGKAAGNALVADREKARKVVDSSPDST